MSLFDEFLQESSLIERKDGEKIPTKAIFASSTLAIVSDSKIPIERGDKISRKLPSGLEEKYYVDDPNFLNGLNDIPPHYQLECHRL